VLRSGRRRERAVADRRADSRQGVLLGRRSRRDGTPQLRRGRGTLPARSLFDDVR